MSVSSRSSEPNVGNALNCRVIGIIEEVQKFAKKFDYDLRTKFRTYNVSVKFGPIACDTDITVG